MTTPRDVIVVGAGLAGLVAALRLRLAGRDVLVLERRAAAGGLCGAFELDGREFAVACNDFGDGLRRELVGLGVPITFRHLRTRLHFGHGRHTLPPDLATAARLARRARSLLALVRAARRDDNATLGEIIDAPGLDPRVADLAALPAFATARSPDDLLARALRDEVSPEYDYGYQRSCAPVGGPGALVDAMVRRFVAMGGAILFDQECASIERDGALQRVRTAGATHVARSVVTSQGRWSEWPGGGRPGLSLGTLLLAVKRGFAFPTGVHAVSHLPAGVAAWLRRLDAGAATDRFGFNLFRCDLAPRGGEYTVNVVFPIPRGEDEPSPERAAALVDYVRREADALLPGLDAATTYWRFVSPRAFRQLHGLAPVPSPALPARGFQKPDLYDPERDLYHVGNSVGPPGEHAGAAALSGRLAAARVDACLARDVRPLRGT